VEILQETLPASDPEVPVTMNNLAVMLRNTSKVETLAKYWEGFHGRHTRS